MSPCGFGKRNVIFVGMAVILAAVCGCPKQGQEKPARSQPAETTATSPGLPAKTPAVVATKPAATEPASTLPASTYESRSPYPVNLYVQSPEDKQPGWLKIVEFDNGKAPATAKGEFPQQNRFYVETQNVKQIQIHVGHLPLAPRQRIILQIDGQGIEIVRKKDRNYVVLERRPTGEWLPQ